MFDPKTATSRPPQAPVVVGVGLLVLGLSLWDPTPTTLPPRFELWVFAPLQFAVLLGIPLWVTRYVLLRPVAEVGLRWGQPRLWLPEVGLGLLLAFPLLVALSRHPSIRAYYPVYAPARAERWLLIPSTLAMGLYGFGWEFLFRGFLQLGTRPSWGRGSVLVPLGPFVVAHLDKPPVEMVLALASGIVLGILAHRHRSVVPPWLLHLTCASLLNLLCVLP